MSKLYNLQSKETQPLCPQIALKKQTIEHEKKEKTPITFKKGRGDEGINTRQTALGQGAQITLFLTNEPSSVKQTAKTNTPHFASGRNFEGK